MQDIDYTLVSFTNNFETPYKIPDTRGDRALQAFLDLFLNLESEVYRWKEDHYTRFLKAVLSILPKEAFEIGVFPCEYPLLQEAMLSGAEHKKNSSEDYQSLEKDLRTQIETRFWSLLEDLKDQTVSQEACNKKPYMLVTAVETGAPPSILKKLASLSQVEAKVGEGNEVSVFGALNDGIEVWLKDIASRDLRYTKKGAGLLSACFQKEYEAKMLEALEIARDQKAKGGLKDVSMMAKEPSGGDRSPAPKPRRKLPKPPQGRSPVASPKPKPRASVSKKAPEGPRIPRSSLVSS